MDCRLFFSSIASGSLGSFVSILSSMFLASISDFFSSSVRRDESTVSRYFLRYSDDTLVMSVM